MSFQYAFLKRLVKLAGLKRMWGGSVDELVAKKKKQNAKNRIPELHDPEIEILLSSSIGRSAHILRGQQASGRCSGRAMWR